MPLILTQIDPILLAVAVVLTVVAGFVKGAVGFALPMIMISGLGSFLSPEVALAALILPTVAANLWQALRDGITAALASALRFRVYIGIVLLFIAGSAQLVRILPDWILYLILGAPVTIFAVAQLMGWRLHLKPAHRRRAEVIIASIAGFIGGLSGVWGPPTVAYLTAIDTPKVEHVRVQGVVYALGAVVLLAAHLNSGVLDGHTAPLSAALIAPAMAGMFLGFWVQDRLDQARFRRATLAVLAVAGLNLVRRGLVG